MNTEILEVNGAKHLVKIFYEHRKNTTVSLGKKAIYIRIPLCLNREERFSHLLKMKAWARKKLLENPKKYKPKSAKEYKDGDILKVGDKEYKLKIEFKDKKSSSAGISANTINFSISSSLSKERQNSHISTLLSRCIAEKRLPGLKKKIHELNKKHFNNKINKIFFKHNKSNWGSCSKSGNINISTRLLFAPDDVLEYVCIHELAHLIEHNHSDRFWALVKKAMPNYKQKQKWLKENSHKCAF